MFTNWLTGSSSSSSGSGSGSASGSNSSSNNNRMTATTANTMALVAASESVAVGCGAVVGVAGGVMSTPPDVILEVGPAPTSVRFVAHALILGMHSGYLRSAIRMDEAATTVATATGNVATVAAAAGELLLYLSNVTAEQFAPLLTYMYTGYLDLNVDNIFAVLLATHVLHMPRALEICRSYLARSQTEGYFTSQQQQQQLPLLVANVAPKIIRPIASKATLPNFGFLPAPAPPPPTVGAVGAVGYVPATTVAAAAEVSLVDATKHDLEEEEEDVEVFIDSNTATDNEIDNEDCNVSVVSSLGSSSAASSLNIERVDPKRPPTPLPAPLPTPTAIPTTGTAATQAKVVTTPATTKQRRGNSNSNAVTRKTHSKRGNCRGMGAATSGLQVAKAPVPALQLEATTATGTGTGTSTATAATKFIIDVASCDGPVRFRRILNTAYGHKPDTCSSATVELQRTQQSVSYSFHQQMARAISSQQRQQQQEENENNNTAAAATTAAATVASAASNVTQQQHQQSRKQTHSELFVCVYCKHTFKSQYCYQKHAKRHLNPLSLDKKLTEATHAASNNSCSSSNNNNNSSSNGSSSNRDNTNAAELLLSAAAAAGATTTSATSAIGIAAGAASATATASSAAADSNLSAAALLRREVRPLDMNVQYYPCKTCGSKFPSYYFVHKHRKLCHADELETTTTSNNNNNNSTSSSSNSGNMAKREATTTAAATATATTVATTADATP